MPDAPALQVQDLHNTRAPPSTPIILIPAGDTQPKADATYRLYFRREVEKVDENDELTGETFNVTDHGNYFEGALTREDASHLRLTFTSTNFTEHIRGSTAQELWQQLDADLPETDLNHWQLTKLAPVNKAAAPADKSVSPWAPFGWGRFVARRSLVGAEFPQSPFADGSILGLLGLFLLQSNQWLTAFGGEAPCNISR